MNRFALATEKHFPRSFTRPTLGGDLNSYLLDSYQTLTDIEVTGGSLEEAFVELTREEAN
ncbi:hypothetical protein [Ferrimicrobium acidiphilum]|uniref:hypothetical protein n=1 Tax=Ferrimicrobium acidiphilum TaxID=121039 RepID=UPI0006973AE4|nr:hypothetical protein [Ferrimicrobium acidiphilum]